VNLNSERDDCDILHSVNRERVNSFITRSNWLYKKGISVKYTTLHAIQLYKHHSLSSTMRRDLIDDQWYLNLVAIVHVTHDHRLFISLDLNVDVIERIETTNDEKIKTRETKTIRLKMIIVKKNINVTMSDVHYCFELNSNLIFLDVLKAKRFDFRDRKNWLSVINKDDDVILQAKRQNNVYSLLQSRHFNCSNSLDKALIVKNVSLDVWH
jgi:hypothetical protein